jgi:hypothetical protein
MGLVLPLHDGVGQQDQSAPDEHLDRQGLVGVCVSDESRQDGGQEERVGGREDRLGGVNQVGFGRTDFPLPGVDQEEGPDRVEQGEACVRKAEVEASV